MCERVSAGVLAYMVSPEGEVRLVLAREQYTKRWGGALKWSEFGGRPKAGEAPLATAAREAFEESLGVFGDPAAALRRGEYNFCLTVLRETPKGRVRRALYVLELPWDPGVAQRFFDRREHLLAVLHTVAQIRRAQRGLRKRGLPTPDAPWRHGAFVVDVARVEVRGGGGAAVITARVTAGGLTTDRAIEVPAGDAELYAELLALKRRLDRLVGALPADLAARALRWREPGADRRRWVPVVDADFLEKDVVRLWPLDEVQGCIYHRTALRPGFVVPLKLALQQLALQPNDRWRE